MGSDDIFKKRKAQAVSALHRQRQSRVKGPRFLIVCEGEKTEPFYFGELCEVHQLRTPRVRIAPGQEGSSPDRVVSYAERLFDEDEQLGPDRYDSVFCVIDRDNHSTFKFALHRIENLQRQGKPFIAITSYPCFEYWLLLHFLYTRKPFHASGRCSIGESATRELRQHPGFKSYAKAQRNTYALLRERTDIALVHADRAEKEADQTGEKNPSTKVHHLVQALRTLAIKNSPLQTQ